MLTWASAFLFGLGPALSLTSACLPLPASFPMGSSLCAGPAAPLPSVPTEHPSQCVRRKPPPKHGLTLVCPPPQNAHCHHTSCSQRASFTMSRPFSVSVRAGILTWRLFFQPPPTPLCPAPRPINSVSFSLFTLSQRALLSSSLVLLPALPFTAMCCRAGYF